MYMLMNVHIDGATTDSPQICEEYQVGILRNGLPRRNEEHFYGGVF